MGASSKFSTRDAIQSCHEIHVSDMSFHNLVIRLSLRFEVHWKPDKKAGYKNNHFS